MLSSPRKNGLTSLFKEARVFKDLGTRVPAAPPGIRKSGQPAQTWEKTAAPSGFCRKLLWMFSQGELLLKIPHTEPQSCCRTLGATTRQISRQIVTLARPDSQVTREQKEDKVTLWKDTWFLRILAFFLENEAFGKRRFSQKTAGNRRKSQETAETRRKPQIGIGPLGFVPSSAALFPVHKIICPQPSSPFPR